MDIDLSNPPEGATHYSEGVTGVYWPGFWKDGDQGCWAFVFDDRKTPEWTFHECCEIPPRAKIIRTAEQIAAEEKQNAWLAGIAAEYDQETAYKCAAVLVAGGYRKQV